MKTKFWLSPIIGYLVGIATFPLWESVTGITKPTALLASLVFGLGGMMLAYIYLDYREYMRRIEEEED